MANPLLSARLCERKGILPYFISLERMILLHFRRLVGQSLSALISTSFQYLSTGSGSHSLTETVYFALLSFLGLESSFHNFSPIFRRTIPYFVIFLSKVWRGKHHTTPF